MKRIITILSLFVSISIFAQTIEEKGQKSPANAIKAMLVAKGVNNYFSYTTFDHPYQSIDETTGKTSAVFQIRTYIFWEEKGKYYVQKTDHLTSYERQEIGTSILNFAIRNITKINIQKIKPYTEKQGVELVEIGTSDPSHILFDFNINNIKFDREISFFDLSNEPNFPNYNYRYNQQLKIIQLLNRCDKLIAQLEKEHKL